MTNTPKQCNVFVLVIEMKGFGVSSWAEGVWGEHCSESTFLPDVWHRVHPAWLCQARARWESGAVLHVLLAEPVGTSGSGRAGAIKLLFPLTEPTVDFFSF